MNHKFEIGDTVKLKPEDANSNTEGLIIGACSFNNINYYEIKLNGENECVERVEEEISYVGTFKYKVNQRITIKDNTELSGMTGIITCARIWENGDKTVKINYYDITLDKGYHSFGAFFKNIGRSERELKGV